MPTSNGSYVSLADFLGKKNVVVYFYPKDFTQGCTAEACSFRDSYESFKDLGAEVIGISSDGQNSHRDFAQQHHLPFILLSDVDGAVRKTYGVKKTLGLFAGRVSFVIDKNGIVNITDAAILTYAWKSTPGTAKWNPDADINRNGIVDITDAAILSKNWKKSIPAC